MISDDNHVPDGAFREGPPPEQPLPVSPDVQNWMQRFRSLCILAGVGVLTFVAGYEVADHRASAKKHDERVLRLKEVRGLVRDVIDWRDVDHRHRIGALHALEKVAEHESKTLADDAALTQEAVTVQKIARESREIIKKNHP